MNNEQRIKTNKIAIDEDDVKLFFNNRVNKNLPYLINYTNYQDKHPELALERDKYEKDRIMPFLNLQPESRILDIGCGVGRWGNHILKILSNQGMYVGADYSGNILNLAKNHFRENKNFYFCESSFQDILLNLPGNIKQNNFNVILINGVMMYINDTDLAQCMSNLKELVTVSGRICIKESVGLQDRLTLNKIYSEELESQYSAIYRGVEEYNILFRDAFSGDKFNIVYQDVMWQGDLANRKETTAYFWIIEKIR